MKKLVDLRPCDDCGGAINPFHFAVTIEQRVVDQTSVRQSVGLMQMLGSMQLADVMGPGIRTEVLNTFTVILCPECACRKLGEFMEPKEAAGISGEPAPAGGKGDLGGHPSHISPEAV